MVVLSGSYIRFLEHETIAEPFILKMAPNVLRYLRYRWYVDNVHPRFKSKEQSRNIQNILNKQDKQIQFTIEDENEEKCLNFLDKNIKNSNG